MKQRTFRPQVVRSLGEIRVAFEGGDPYLFEFTNM